MVNSESARRIRPPWRAAMSGNRFISSATKKSISPIPGDARQRGVVAVVDVRICRCPRRAGVFDGSFAPPVEGAGMRYFHLRAHRPAAGAASESSVRSEVASVRIVDAKLATSRGRARPSRNSPDRAAGRDLPRLLRGAIGRICPPPSLSRSSASAASAILTLSRQRFAGVSFARDWMVTRRHLAPGRSVVHRARLLGRAGGMVARTRRRRHATRQGGGDDSNQRSASRMTCYSRPQSTAHTQRRDLAVPLSPRTSTSSEGRVRVKPQIPHCSDVPKCPTLPS